MHLHKLHKLGHSRSRNHTRTRIMSQVANSQLSMEPSTLCFLGELPVNQDSFIPAKSQESADPIGIRVAEIDRDNPSMVNLPDGVVVSRVNPGSPASGKVIRGDLITMIQYKGSKYEVFDVESYEEAIDNFSSGDKIALHLNRNGSRIIRSITIN